jgi:type IV secretory pathway VirD2 relaxase
MQREDEEHFRLRVRGPRKDSVRTGAFVKRVLKAKAKASGSHASGASTYARSRTHRGRPGSRLGRGHVAAAVARQTLGSRSRRVAVKTRLVPLRSASRRTTTMHLRYIERDGVAQDGSQGHLYGPETNEIDAQEFEEKGHSDRHQFRFIVSPEDAAELSDLKGFTRRLMQQLERDLGTRLDWVAVDHWDTDNPHTHVVLLGKDDTGGDLIISGEYIAHGIRARAAGIATEWLGERTDFEIRQSITKEVNQERWTSLDLEIQQRVDHGTLDLRAGVLTAEDQRRSSLLSARLERLSSMGLAREVAEGVWSVSPEAERTLRRMGERDDIVRTLQRVFREEQREFSVFDGSAVTGRVAAKGLADELTDRGYLIVDGVDGRAHYVALAAGVDLGDIPAGAVVTVRQVDTRAVDRTIATMATDGIYATDHHLEYARARGLNRYDPVEYIQRHVRRLEALRREGIVERIDEGLWRVPEDLIERGQAYDRSRTSGMHFDVRSFLPIEQQKRSIGATWLDRELIGDRAGIGTSGFGGEVRSALEERERFLMEQGLATRQGSRTVLVPNLLTLLRSQELEHVAEKLSRESGLEYHAALDGECLSGTYRRPVTLASGRFAMLDDGQGFTLVPWRPIIEPRRGQVVSALVRGDTVSWEFGRARGLSR